MRRFNWLTLCMAGAFACFSAATTKGQGENLQWKLTPGHELLFEMNQSISMKMTIGGNKIDNTNNTKTWMSWKVQEFDQATKTATVESTIDRMTMDMQTPVGKIAFDSEDETDNPAAAAIAKSIRPMIGSASIQQMTPAGKILEVKLSDEMEKSLGAMGGPQMIQMVKEMSKQASLEFPEGTLQKDQTWTVDSESSSPAGKVGLKRTYTYLGKTQREGKEFDQFDVDLEMKFLQPPNGATIDIVDQSTKGILYFDREKGRIDSSQIEQNVTMKIGAGGQQIDQVLTQSMTLKVRDKSAASTLKKAG